MNQLSHLSWRILIRWADGQITDEPIGVTPYGALERMAELLNPETPVLPSPAPVPPDAGGPYLVVGIMGSAALIWRSSDADGIVPPSKADDVLRRWPQTAAEMAALSLPFGAEAEAWAARPGARPRWQIGSTGQVSSYGDLLPHLGDLPVVGGDWLILGGEYPVIYRVHRVAPDRHRGAYPSGWVCQIVRTVAVDHLTFGSDFIDLGRLPRLHDLAAVWPAQTEPAVLRAVQAIALRRGP